MKRKARQIGLALVGCLALAGVGAQGAQATEFTAGSYPVPLHGTQPAGSPHIFEVGNGSTQCSTATFSGTLTGPTTVMTITPNYGGANGCESFGLKSTLTMNGCDFVFRTGSSGNSGTLDIECSAGQTITKDTAGNLCNTHIGTQTGLPGVTYANNGNHIDVVMNVTTIHAVVTGTIFCPVASSTTTYTNAKYTGAFTLKGNGGLVKIDVG